MNINDEILIEIKIYVDLINLKILYIKPIRLDKAFLDENLHRNSSIEIVTVEKRHS